MPATYFPFRWIVGTFQEILDSSSGNSARIKSMTDLMVPAFTGCTEARYSSIELNRGDFRFLLFFSLIIQSLTIENLRHEFFDPCLAGFGLFGGGKIEDVCPLP